MDKYLIVKVPDADYKYEEPMTFMGQTRMVGRTVMSRIGEAVRLASEKHFVGASWVATHSSGMTIAESEQIAEIFARVEKRARAANPNKYRHRPVK